jgi:hypothetical protein
VDVPDEVAGDHFDGVATDFGIACGGPDQPEQVLTLRDRRKIPGAHSEGSIWRWHGTRSAKQLQPQKCCSVCTCDFVRHCRIGSLIVHYPRMDCDCILTVCP